MKKPLLNLEQREAIRLDTYYGANLNFSLAVIRFRRELYRSSHFGWFLMKFFDYTAKIEVRYKTNKDK